jgi:hypothetical protein
LRLNLFLVSRVNVNDKFVYNMIHKNGGDANNCNNNDKNKKQIKLNKAFIFDDRLNRIKEDNEERINKINDKLNSMLKQHTNDTNSN